MHPTSVHASSWGTLSCFKLCISKQRFCSCTWKTPNPRSCIGVSCNLIAISNSSAWVEIFFCDNTVLRCGVKDATNHAQCCVSFSVMLALRIVFFSLWSRSHGVSPGSITISLNPMIDYVSDLGQLNSLFNASSIAAIPAFGWSREYFIYHVNARSYNALTREAFLMFSSIMLWAPHTTSTTN